MLLILFLKTLLILVLLLFLENILTGNTKIFSSALEIIILVSSDFLQRSALSLSMLFEGHLFLPSPVQLLLRFHCLSNLVISLYCTQCCMYFYLLQLGFVELDCLLVFFMSFWKCLAINSSNIASVAFIYIFFSPSETDQTQVGPSNFIFMSLPFSIFYPFVSLCYILDFFTSHFYITNTLFSLVNSVTILFTELFLVI